MNKEKRLSMKTLIGYGVGDVGGNLFFTAIGFWLMNYLTDNAGLSAILAGIAIMIGKVWDAVADPVVGYLSDRTKSKMGRRRPWMLAGAFPLGILFFLMFTNFHIKNSVILAILTSILFIVLCTCYTFVNIPYNALTPDITKDYEEKTRLNGFRMSFAALGTLIGAGVVQSIVGLFKDKSAGYMAMGAIFGLIMIIAALIPFFTIKEPVIAESAKNERNIFLSYLAAFKNIPFLLILMPWALNIIGITILTTTLVYYFKYLMNNEGLTTITMLIFILTAICFLPAAVIVSRKIGKKATYISGMMIFSAAVLSIFFFGHILPLYFIFTMMFVAGTGFSTHYVMPFAIIPDTIEYDYLKSGKRNEGVYYGLWNFMVKFGQGFAVFLVGNILAVFGYMPNVSQSPEALFGIRFLVGPITSLFFIAANLILALYPINKRKYLEIQEQIKIMEEKSGTLAAENK